MIAADAAKDARRHLPVLAGILLLLGVTVVVWPASTPHPASPPSPPKLAPPPSAQPKAISPLAASEPVHILIRSIKISAPFVRLGLKPNGELDTPKDPATVGWYTQSPAPGALGPSIIAGHVTWNREPSAFFRLGLLRPGDQVHIRRADHKTAVFTVTRIATYPKDRFPTREVYGDLNHAGLRLITCGGQYTKTTHRYLANVVAYARLTDVR